MIKMFKITSTVFAILFFGVMITILQPLSFGETSHALDFPIALKMGETAKIDSELEMTLLDIEDSRCPSDVTCIWQGTVTAKINLEKGTQDLGVYNISLDMGENEKTFDGYYIRLTNVEPYPISTEPLELADYTLTFVISEGAKDQIYSPLKQFKIGVPVSEIKCRDDLVLMIKNSDSTPSCVSHFTSEKLILREWGELAEVPRIQPIIKTGTNAGFCIGYCMKEFVITPEKIIYTNNARSFEENTEFPLIIKEVSFSESEWNELVRLVDFEKFNSLPDRVGCPGCADAPVEWIEITSGSKTKKIEFEHGDEPPEIKRLVLALEAIRNPIESTVESFEDCVAAGNPVMESYPRQCRTDDGKSFVEPVDLPLPVDSQCKKYDGEWLSEWNECEYVSEPQCIAMNGDYYECESACRHDPNAEVCTEQCVPVCVIP